MIELQWSSIYKYKTPCTAKYRNSKKCWLLWDHLEGKFRPWVSVCRGVGGCCARHVRAWGYPRDKLQLRKFVFCLWLSAVRVAWYFVLAVVVALRLCHWVTSLQWEDPVLTVRELLHQTSIIHWIVVSSLGQEGRTVGLVTIKARTAATLIVSQDKTLPVPSPHQARQASSLATCLGLKMTRKTDFYLRLH